MLYTVFYVEYEGAQLLNFTSFRDEWTNHQYLSLSWSFKLINVQLSPPKTLNDDDDNDSDDDDDDNYDDDDYDQQTLESRSVPRAVDSMINTCPRVNLPLPLRLSSFRRILVSISHGNWFPREYRRENCAPRGPGLTVRRWAGRPPPPISALYFLLHILYNWFSSHYVYINNLLCTSCNRAW